MYNVYLIAVPSQLPTSQPSIPTSQPSTAPTIPRNIKSSGDNGLSSGMLAVAVIIPLFVVLIMGYIGYNVYIGKSRKENAYKTPSGDEESGNQMYTKADVKKTVASASSDTGKGGLYFNRSHMIALPSAL